MTAAAMHIRSVRLGAIAALSLVVRLGLMMGLRGMAGMPRIGLPMAPLEAVLRLAHMAF